MQLLKKNSPYVLAALAATQAKLPQIHAQSATNTPTLLSPVVVTEKRVPATPDQTYSTPQAQTATWTDTPIVATPMSIQVIPLQVIQDQGVDRVKDVYRNVSGVMPVKSESSGIQFENAYIRGFSQRMYV
ncbi:MAG TPA: TonB-dependent receptor plug domain-containing protein, partial [Dongiaceae bacterium]|nr:TonB-dependent receptor plug domain-containing protein [Dongiaceae bacterium]